MKVFELMIDWDGTLRSQYSSEGLFSTYKKAEGHFEEIAKHTPVYGGHKIVPRTVF